MSREQLIEKLAKKISDENIYSDLAPSWYMTHAKIAVNMFWPLVEAAVKVHSYKHLDEDSSVCLLEAASRSMGALDRAVTALSNLKGELK